MNQGEDRYARLAARLLRDEQPQAEPRPFDGRRDAVVAAMTLAIAGRTRRRRIAWSVAGALAIAAAVVLLVRGPGGDGAARLVVEHVVGQGGVLVRGGTPQPLAERRALVPGDIVRAAPTGRVALLSGHGTHLTLSPAGSSAGELRFDETGARRRFSLASGLLQAQVGKLAAGERFLVHTPDSEVEVRGTLFTIVIGQAPAGCRGAATRSSVQVSQGAVWVRSAGSEIVLEPGETWAAPCVESRAGSEPSAPPPAARADASRPASVPARPGARHGGAKAFVASPAAASVGATVSLGAPSARHEGPANPAPVSRLAEQNDLFAAAMVAERAGQHEVALRRLDDLILRFPNGPLRESAQAEKQRILSAESPR